MPMISSASPSLSRTPSFWLTVVCIWISGWVSGAVTSLWLPNRLGGTGLGLSLVYHSVAAAFVGAFVLRSLLPRLADASISYPWAVLALGLGGLAGNGFAYAVQTFTVRHVSITVMPMLSSNPLLALVSMAIGFGVSYQVIAVSTAPRSSRSAKPVSASGSAQVAGDDWYDVLPASGDIPANAGLDNVVARTQEAAAQICIDVSRSRASEMAGRIVDALTELGTCVHRLQHSTCSDPKVRAEIDRLVDGLNRFQTSLTQIAADASATGTHRMYQPGALFGSMADVSDGGGLARYELDHADGLEEIRESFERLRALGILHDRRDVLRS
jgi:hypothetical protein